MPVLAKFRLRRREENGAAAVLFVAVGITAVDSTIVFSVEIR
jgi:hypothetical protein